MFDDLLDPEYYDAAVNDALGITNAEDVYVLNPWESEAQRRACHAKDDPDWDCDEWEEATPDDARLPERKPAANCRRIARGKGRLVKNRRTKILRPAGAPVRNRIVNPLRADPTRTQTLRRQFIAGLGKRFGQLKALVRRLVLDDDAFGLTANAAKVKDRAATRNRMEIPSRSIDVDDWMFDPTGEMEAPVACPFCGYKQVNSPDRTRCDHCGRLWPVDGETRPEERGWVMNEQLRDALGRWASGLDVDELRHGTDTDSATFRNAVDHGAGTDSTVYRGISLPRDTKVEVGAVLDLPRVASFSSSKDTARQFSRMSAVLSKKLGLGDHRPVVFEAARLGSGIPVDHPLFAEQEEHITSGRLRVKSVREGPNGSLHVTAEHLPRVTTNDAVADIEAAERRVHPNPTPAQREAGNYRKGHVRIQGLDVAIETPKGAERKGSTLSHSYGYFKRTVSGADGDAVDVFLGPNPDSPSVYVVDQLKWDGSFDEHKVMLGFDSPEAARRAYLSNYPAGWKGCGAVTALSVDELKEWLEDGDTGEPLSGGINNRSDAVEVRLARAARRVVESVKDDVGPDYQRLFWNAGTKTAWWVSFDGDDTRAVQEIHEALGAVPGVEAVGGESEGFPRGWKDGVESWVELDWRRGLQTNNAEDEPRDESGRWTKGEGFSGIDSLKETKRLTRKLPDEATWKELMRGVWDREAADMDMADESFEETCGAGLCGFMNRELQSVLKKSGIKTRLVEGGYDAGGQSVDHVWLETPSGTIIDGAESQFRNDVPLGQITLHPKGSSRYGDYIHNRRGSAAATLIEVPNIRQRDGYSCGAAAVMSVCRYYGVGPDSLTDYKEALETTRRDGTEPEAVFTYLKELGLQIEASSFRAIADLRTAFAKGRPVICAVQSYGPSRRAHDGYGNGHYVVVIGAAFGYVFVQDPSADNVLAGEGSAAAPGRVMIPEDEFLRIWHDEDADGNRYERWGVVVGPPRGASDVRAAKGVENFDPDQPRDEHGRFGSGGGGAEVEIKDSPHPGSRDLPTGYKRDNDIVMEDVADDLNVSLDRIDTALQGHVSKRHIMSREEDYDILAALADEGVVESGKASRGLAFDSEAGADDYVRKTFGSGWYKTPDKGAPPSFTEAPEVAHKFATQGSAQVMGDRPRNSHGVIVEVSSEPNRVLRGFRLDYGEAEVVLPRDQAYKVTGVKKHKDENGYVTHVVSLVHAPQPTHNFDPDQQRDERGRFGSGTGSSRGETLKTAVGIAVGEAKERAQDVLDKFKAGMEKVNSLPVLRHLKAAGDYLKAKTVDLYRGLEGRYGRKAAIGIMGSAQVLGWGALGVGAAIGVPLYLPGVSIWGSLPAAAVAETFLQARRAVKAVKTVMDPLKGLPAMNAEAEAEERGAALTGEQTERLAREFMKRVNAAFVGYVKENADALKAAHDYSDPTDNATPAVNTRWADLYDSERVDAFEDWLEQQFLSTIGGDGEQDLWKRYVQAGYAKGAARSFDDVKAAARAQAGGDEAALSFYAGTKDQFLRDAFAQPVSVDKVRLLASRSFGEMKNVTADMKNRMVRVLADGLVQGKSPRTVAKDLDDALDFGRGRAEVVARTELIRAHADGQLTALEKLGVEELGVDVEWSTTGDGKVCPKCEGMEGQVFKIEEAKGMIPRHPNCRCAWLPALSEEDDPTGNARRRNRTTVRNAPAAEEDWSPLVGNAAERVAADSFETWLVTSAFTGVVTDKRGRKMYFVEGKRVKNPETEAKTQTKAAEKEAKATARKAKAEEYARVRGPAFAAAEEIGRGEEATPERLATIGASLMSLTQKDVTALKKAMGKAGVAARRGGAVEAIKGAALKAAAKGGDDHDGIGKPRGGSAGSEPARDGGKVEEKAGRPADEAAAGIGPSTVEPAGAAAADRVPAGTEGVNRKLNRYEALFRSRGNHKVADWMGQLREHVNAVGVDEALASLGGEVKGAGHKGQIVYEGAVAPDDNPGQFFEHYLDRFGITPGYMAGGGAGYAGRISAQIAPETETPLTFKPDNPAFKNKLEEAKALPGLEASEDVAKLMGRPVTHLTDDVVAKMNERYGEGGWIIKSYGEDAYAGHGIFFPQFINQQKTDARNALWESGSHLANYGFQHLRDEGGKVVGIKHEGGDEYRFGTEKYEHTIHGEARRWGDVAAEAAENEHGPALLDRGGNVSGKDFMVQPAFKAVGVSDAERAAGTTIVKGEGRVHVVTRNGRAELVPHSTWIKKEWLPVVFENDDTRAMAKAALDAINALPESARQNQIYAPDVMKTADGYKVVEANPSDPQTGSSGYLEDSPFIIDSYVSHLTGREPAHVRFIRNLLTEKKRGERKGKRRP